MLTFTLLAADAAQPSGQLWRPLLIFGVIAGLMALVVRLQVTDPRRRSRGVTDSGVALTSDDSPPTPPAARARTCRGRPSCRGRGPGSGPEGG